MGLTFLEVHLGWAGQAPNLSEQFAVFKDGLNRAHTSVWNEFGYLLLGVAVLALVALIYHWLAHRRLVHIKIWHEETDPCVIKRALQRAADRWAEYQLEVFNPNYPEIYRGRFLAVRPDGCLLLGLSSFQNIELDFSHEPALAIITFRSQPGRLLEQYQFNTHTLGLATFQDAHLKEPALVVNSPLRLTTAERRHFRRLEPLGLQSLQAEFFERPTKNNPQLNRLPDLGLAQVLNISLKGLLVVLPLKPGQSSKFKPAREVTLKLDLPLDGLDPALKTTRVLIRGKILTADFVPAPGQPANSRACSIRLLFTGRYRLRSDRSGYEFIIFSPESFQDLAYWLNACERLSLRKERGTESRPFHS